MKSLVTYWSQTGNTKKVAEAIYDALPGEKRLATFAEVDSVEGFGLVFAGFPVMQFGPPATARKFIATLPAGTKVALFVTHAMPANSDDQQQQVLLAKELDRCRSAFSKCNLSGFFHCQGELAETTASELLASNIPMLMEFAAMRPITMGHPTWNELARAREFARETAAGC